MVPIFPVVLLPDQSLDFHHSIGYRAKSYSMATLEHLKAIK
jgi:hypothetical protein